MSFLVEFVAQNNIHMWFSLGITVMAVYLFVREKIPLEVTSIIILTALMLFGHFFPLSGEGGNYNTLSPEALLKGFANPALIAVLALLVMGQGLVQTDALRYVTNAFVTENKVAAWFSILFIFIFVAVISAFMNNTPLVVVAIPILQILAQTAGISQSRVMMPLSFVAILGGMTTLVGSSTNLLVSSSLVELGYDALGFFDFVVPGAMLAVIGFLYTVIISPYFLKKRGSMVTDLASSTKEFVAELNIDEESKLVGMEAKDGKFSALKNVNVKLVQRRGQLILPPFNDYTVEPNDVFIVTATKDSLAAMLAKYPGSMLDDDEEEQWIEGDEEDKPRPNSRVLAELMITPASRMVDMSLEHVNFQRQFGVIVLGIQRRARVVRRRLGRIRLESGDVLLIAGDRKEVNAMRASSDFIMLSGSKREMPNLKKAPLAVGIFMGVIALAALSVVSIPVAAITGAGLMILAGCLNIHQATRSIDRKIFLLVGSMLALGVALEASGGALFLAEQILSVPFAQTPFMMVSLLFILVAICTNILSNNACAILFTPIAMNLAKSFDGLEGLNYDLTFIFALTVLFGANCSFASPIGYQTNLLVMGPGHYRFRDFLKAGVPLVVVMWIGFMAVAKFYFGL